MHHNDNRIIQSNTLMVFMKLITELQNILRKNDAIAIKSEDPW
jgi:hypothetical protein